VISASHNPFQDNGIKIFSREGFKISDDREREIESLVLSDRMDELRATPSDIGKAHRVEDAVGRYIEFCKRTFPSDLVLDGIRLVVDCANGATYKIAPIVFAELGARVVAIHHEPNGRNINERCGSQHTDDLSAAVREHGADAGLAFDGDGDRLIPLDERGDALSGDHLIAICAADYQRRGMLAGNLVIVTPMSNLGMRLALEAMGIRCEDAPVGDRNVLDLMRRRGAVLGGEQSGHVIYRDLHTTGDGIVSALQLLAVMRRTGRKLSDLGGIFRPAPQRLVNVDVAKKPPIEDIPPLIDAIRKAEAELAGKGRVLVRYSGTQPICRVMVEAATVDQTDRLAAELAACVRREIG